MDQVTSSGAHGVGALSHPLPSGMRDLLPEEAEEQLRLSRLVLGSFELCGFEQVILPVFEYADVLEQGLGHIEPNSVLRFVEPETGEVVALRPDMTPQVARLVATRLSSEPEPIRLSYSGSVLRRRHERARHHQQIVQAGIELVGRAGPEGDLEVLRVSTDAVRTAGLTDFVLDLGHGRIAQSLLDSVDGDLKSSLLESLTLKDTTELVRRAEEAKLDGALVRALAALPSLSGGEGIFTEAKKTLGGTSAWPFVEELERLHRAASAAGLAPGIVVDLGETRAFEYYTGPLFQVLAEGPGQAVGSGGRYDSLYARFGAPRRAAGFAIQIDNLRWALGTKNRASAPRALVVPESAAGDGADACESALGTLRAAKIPSAVAGGTNPLDYARAWRYSHVVWLTAEGRARLSRVTPEGQELALGELPLGELPSKILAG
jgi:ATP phosphoribosyltransferase regulatory subunit